MSTKRLFQLAATALLAVTANAHALFIPFGVMNDVNIGTVTGTWGWTLCDVRTYATNNSGGMASLNAACQNSELIMLAGRRTGSDILDVLAATTVLDATTDTGAANNGLTTSSNGAEWYYNTDFSWGFAGAGDSVSKTQCDTNGQGERDRLCWHTLNFDVGGWRSGNNTNLNSSLDFEKLVFVANRIDVPEPMTLGLLGLGLIGVGARRRTRA